MEEYAIEVIVVVLTGVGKDYIKVLAALVDDGSKTDDLRACTDNDTELEFTVLLPVDVGIIEFGLFFHIVLMFLLLFGLMVFISIENDCR